MRILYKRILEDGVALIEAAGVSLEDKPTAGIATGSKFIEVDTGKEYRFAEGDNPTWYDQNPTPEDTTPDAEES